MEIKKEDYNILYVDDEENNLNSFRAALRRDYNVFTGAQRRGRHGNSFEE
jgi:response regulator RpfG family c-di-GMP phosphodiesterase